MIPLRGRSMSLHTLLADADAGPLPAADSDSSPEVTGICLDTRQAAEGFLYLALPGKVTHGLNFVAQAIERKVLAIAAEPGELPRFETARAAMQDAGIVFVEVPRLKQRAGSIAARFFGEPSEAVRVVAVTGTDGKTSVCHFVQSALASLGVRCGYIGTLGWGFADALETTELTTPDAVSLQAMMAALREAGATVITLEASSHGLAEGRLDAVAIDVAVLTNLGRDHLDYHLSLDNYRAAKALLFAWPTLQAQVLNLADPFGRALAAADARPAIWGFDSRTDNDAVRPAGPGITVQAVQSQASGLQFELVEADQACTVSSPLVGHFNIDNLLACYGVLRGLGHAANDACAALASVRPVPGRMERFAAPGQAAVVVDFAHTPEALAAALRAARQHCSGRLWVVFGCGGDRDAGKRAPMGSAAEQADRIIITDDNPRTENAAAIRTQILSGLSQPERAVMIADRTQAIAHALSHSAEDDVILLAGKGHEDYQIVGTERRQYSDRATVTRLLQEACA